jgi:putative ABC transport system ATP-binding protein
MSDSSTTSGGPLLVLQDVVKHYPNGDVTAVSHVSMTVRQGEYVAIMGPSGCGKSSLLNLIGGLDTPTSGEVFYKGRPLSGLRSLDDYRALEIGFVFQSFHLLPTLTALENVQIPLFARSSSAAGRLARARELLSLVGMDHRLHALPSRMSIGERQRVAIARAIANGSALLLADEPTGNLDSAHGAQILELFGKLHLERGMTLIVITHCNEVAARADRVVFLRDGRIEREVCRR